MKTSSLKGFLFSVLSLLTISKDHKEYKNSVKDTFTPLPSFCRKMGLNK